jgi:hypothetical protein
MATIDRAEARKHLERGHPVSFRGRQLDRVGDLPAEDVKGAEFVALRHEDGSMTRDNMAQIIGRGESVMIGSTVISKLEDLPPEHVMAAGDVTKLTSVVSSFDEQIARLHAQRTAAADAMEEAKKKAAESPPPEDKPAEPDRPAHPHAAHAAHAPAKGSHPHQTHGHKEK